MVFVARIDARVVVDLDHIAAPADQLQVNAIEAIADQVRRAQRAVDDHARRLANGERERLALGVRIGFVLVHLPVARCHEVLAHEERAPVEHRDAPVEFGRHVFLGDDQLRLVEHAAHELVELRRVVRLVHADGEAAARLFQNDWHAERRRDGVDVVAMNHHCARHWDAMAREELVQIDLVVALEDRIGIVDHHEAGSGYARSEAVRVVVEEGRIAQEQGIEFTEAIDRLLVEDLRPHADRLCRPQETVERVAIGRWQRRIGVVEDGERRPPGASCRRRWAAMQIAGRRAQERRPVFRRNVRDAEHPYLLQPPAAAAATQCGAQQRRLGVGEQPLGEGVALAFRVRAEVHLDLERFACRRRLRCERLDLSHRRRVRRVRVQVLERLCRGQRPLPARLGEQRDVKPRIVGARASA